MIFYFGFRDSYLSSTDSIAWSDGISENLSDQDKKMDILTGRIIYSGDAKGTVLKSDMPISFFGAVDQMTGVIKEPNHPLFGQSIAGKILVFPYAKGSTVGSYILYALKKNNVAPAGMILVECETIVAVGAIISEIPTVDQIKIEQFQTGDLIRIDKGEIFIEEKSYR